ncbi:MAG: M14 family zinc carboxypeptidase [Azonexus sp.]
MHRIAPILLLALSSLLLPSAALAAPAAQTASGEDWCAAIGKRLGSVPPATCRKLGLQAAPVVSGRGHALMWRDVAPPTRKIARADNKPPARARRILLIGGIHGDELTSASIVFRWLQWLDEADSEARQYHWRVIPVANPDGLLNNPPQRMNSHGVDLNRNFPTPDWESDAHAYWAKKTNRDPRRFPGQKAMSETETGWLREQIENFKPDVVVSVHAPFGILDYDGPAHQPRRFGHLNLNRLGIYPGSLGNYGGVAKNLPVITIELPNATSMPPPREQREIWEDMLTWLRRNIASKTTS